MGHSRQGRASCRSGHFRSAPKATDNRLRSRWARSERYLNAAICRPLAYSMTSSAIASSVGGTVRPIDLAVPALMTSSNFVGRSAGTSAGISPFRIRPHVEPGLAKHAHQPADLWKRTIDVDRRDRMARRQCRKLHKPVGKKDGWANKQRVGPFFYQARQGAVDLADRAGGENIELAPEPCGRRLHLIRQGAAENQVIWLEKQGVTRSRRQELMHESELLASDFGAHVYDASDIAAPPIETCDEAGLHRVGRAPENDRNRAKMGCD